MTESLLTGLLYLAMAAVAITLGFGVFTLARKGDEARSQSNKLMRLRVLLQFIAVLLIVVIFFFKSQFSGG